MGRGLSFPHAEAHPQSVPSLPTAAITMNLSKVRTNRRSGEQCEWLKNSLRAIWGEKDPSKCAFKSHRWGPRSDAKCAQCCSDNGIRDWYKIKLKRTLEMCRCGKPAASGASDFEESSHQHWVLVGTV